MSDLDRTTDASDEGDSRDSKRTLGTEQGRTTGDVVGEATGGLAGAATGAALGSLGGPIGTIIGGIAGAVGGWWSGHAISHAASHYTENDDAYYRSQFESRRAGGALRPDAVDRTAGSADDLAGARTGRYAGDYASYRPAYQLGHLAAHNPDYGARSFDDVESELRRGWSDDVSGRHGAWDENRDHARSAYERARQSRGGSTADREVNREAGRDTEFPGSGAGER